MPKALKLDITVDDAGAIQKLKQFDATTATTGASASSHLRLVTTEFAKLGTEIPPQVARLASTISDLAAQGGTAAEQATRIAEAVDQFSGSEALAKAHAYAAAVEGIGGVTKLTADEKEHLGRALEEALAKYKALGQNAPKEITKLHQETKTFAGTIDGLFKKLGPLGSLIAGAFTVAGITNAIKMTADYGAEVQDLSQRFDMSTTRVQQFMAAARAHGTTVGSLANAMTQLAIRIDGGDASVVAALRELNLSADELRGMSLDDQFVAVSQRIGELTNNTQQQTVGYRLMGRSAGELLPVMKNLTDDMKDATVWNEQSIKQAAELDKQWERLVSSGKRLIGEAVGPLAPAFKFLADSLADVTKQKREFEEFGQITADTTAMVSAAVDKLAKARAESFNVNVDASLTAEEYERINEELTKQAEHLIRINTLTEGLYGNDLLTRAREYSDAVASMNDVMPPTAAGQQELTRVMTEALEVLRATGQGASDLAKRYEALKNAAAGLNADGTLKASSINMGLMMAPDVQGMDLERQTETYDAQRRIAEAAAWEEQVRLSNEAMTEGLFIIGDTEAAHLAAGEAAASGTAKAALGYAGLERSIRGADAALKLLVPQGTSFTKAYENAGFIVHDTVTAGAQDFARRETQRRTSHAAGTLVSVNVDAAGAIFDTDRTVSHLASQIRGALSGQLGAG